MFFDQLFFACCRSMSLHIFAATKAFLLFSGPGRSRTSQIEVLAQDLPCFAGLRSVLTANLSLAQSTPTVQSCSQLGKTRSDAIRSWLNQAGVDSW